MALDFPNSPVNGQTYAGFVYDSTEGVWRIRPGFSSPAGISATTGSPAEVTSGGYKYYTFTGNGSITVTVAGLADVLCIGGGGGGGYMSNRYGGGGGGAGGVFGQENVYLPIGTHTVIVGAGGAAPIRASAITPSPGNETTLGSFIVGAGGGQGGSDGNGGVPYREHSSGVKGGSGGGGKANQYGGGPGISNQGNAGGDGAAIDSGGGGGGGATAAGSDAVASGSGIGGNGGAGTSAFSVWGVATSTGQDVSGTRWYAGGGGGGSNGTAGSGGNGGGGAGATQTSNGTSGSANTGGGGGGAEEGNGGAGGSGIVIVRVAV